MKRMISLLLVFCMTLSLFAVPASAAQAEGGRDAPFSDVPEDAWYYGDVDYVYENGIFQGLTETLFGPDDELSRGMFVTVLGRMAGVKTENYPGGGDFSDVPEDAYYAPYVAWAVKYGVTGGTGGGRFSPDVPVTRQEMAAFFVRYFEAFDVDYGAEKADSSMAAPQDLDRAAPWAADAVEKLWRVGLLKGDGGSFLPESRATRAQAAAVCHRAADAVKTWYSEPGKRRASNLYSVNFYDENRRIDTMWVEKNQPLKRVPAVEKSSKPGAILLGYYTDPELTQPFYAEEPVTRDLQVYAKYQEMESTETLNFTSFAQMDQSPDLSFRIRRVSGQVAPENAAVLVVKDGSDPVKLAVSAAVPEPPATEEGAEPLSETPDTQEPEPSAEPVYVVAAQGGFREGCSYELTLAEGWVFDEKPETIRTASFSIFKEEVDNIRMGRDVKYLEDTDDIRYTVNGTTYDVLTSQLVTEQGGSFTYDGTPALEENDILCIYVGTHPNERSTKNGRELLDPAVYVKVSAVQGSRVSFEPLGEEDQTKLYDVPDNFPLLVDELPAEETGAAAFDKLDVSMYEIMMGKEDGNLDYAQAHLSTGDFVTLYTGDIRSEDDVYFGEITGYDPETGVVSYRRTTRQAILDSMELYAGIDLQGSDLVTPEEQEEIAASVQAELEDSGFGEQAAYLLAELVESTDQFQNDLTLQEFLTARADLADAPTQLSAMDGITLDGESVVVKARLVTNGSQLHFNGGVQLAVDVKARFNAPINNSLSNTLSIDLAATFVQEVAVRPTVQGGLVYKEILGFIPVPIGVKVGASIDVKNYTALSFDAEISTHDNSGILYSTSIISDLKDLMGTAEETGLSADYQNSLDALMAKYSEMLFQETDWITLVEEALFKDVEVGIYAIGIGISGAFVVKTDMSIAIGSSLEYEMGKRYSFWFKIGLFKPTAGSSTMDLLDESFAFRFYVMGKLGIRAGVKLTLYVQIGHGKLAKAGVSVDFGPYLKLYGFFIYELSKYRPKGSDRWNYSEQMAGALFLEFGLYVTLSFEAEALSFFEYSYDFLDEEFPLATAGEEKYFYGFNYKPMEDESVVIRDDDRNGENGIAMVLPDRVRELSYMTLNTGMRGYMPLPLDRYHFTVSNPNFTYDEATGTVHVTVPENTHFMECDLTVTYLHGKLAFSTYDMSVTVPLVWTDLSDRELNEYFTASVRVGNDTDGYETVWSRKVLRGQAFDLPTDAEVKALIHYNGAKYARADGYQAGQPLEELTVYTDTEYDYGVSYQTYELAVEGVQNADGTTTGQTFTARYGQPFDFSALKATGTDLPGQTYTRFANVTAGGVDLSHSINGAMAEWLNEGAPATANYVDDSVTAVFTFSGITHEDVTEKGRKGATPGTAGVAEAVSEVGSSDGSVGIQEIAPELGNLYQSANYIVTCVTLTGERAAVSFDRNDGGAEEAPAALDKLVGSLIVNLPGEITRTGYTFDGWYTEAGGGQRAETRTVPAGGITLYAHWVPKEYTVRFHVNGGSGAAPEDLTVTYDSAYGTLPEPTPRSGERFVGWYTEQDGGTEITADSIVEITGTQTLYAHYKPLVEIDPNWLVFGQREEFIYEKGVIRTADYTFNEDDPGMVSEDGVGFPTEGFTLVYVPTQGGLGVSTEDPVNAGTFKVRVTRPADGLYAAFEAEYPDVLFIERAHRDLSSARPDADNSLIGFNYLSVGTTLDDLGPGARVSFTMDLDGREGTTTGDGKCFFHDLNMNSGYTATLTYVSVTDDPNYYDASGSVNASASLRTTSAPTGSWSSYAGSLTLNIYTAADLAALMVAVQNDDQCAGRTFTLQNDIDMSAHQWNTAGKIFNGTFDGQGYKIYGLYSDQSGSGDVGLFGGIGSQGTVKNVLLAGGYICGANRVGAIAGYGHDGAIINNCVNYAAIRAVGGGDTDAGGIVGKVSYSQNDHGTAVLNCVNYGSVSGSGYHTGGIMGYQMGASVIANCANYGSVYGARDCVGGIAGENYNKESKVYNCVNAGSVTGSNKYRGAIVGRNNDNDGHVDQCYYLHGSAPNRNAAGSDDGTVDDDHKHLKCSAFSSYAGIPDRTVEDGCGGQTLLYALNHWADRCGGEYENWTLTGPGGAPVPRYVPTL